jgi:glycosyltransferase involved in cell wall biosynthesis
LAFVRQSGLEQHVVCLSNPPTEVIQALYSVAAALLFPSLYEGFGWPPVEAQACGCPVVASNAGSLAEVLGGSALTFAAEDEAGMAEALRRCCEDAQVREGLRRSGFANAARFNPPAWCKATCVPIGRSGKSPRRNSRGSRPRPPRSRPNSGCKRG